MRSSRKHCQGGQEMKVITLGEIMLRLSPEGYLRFLQADKFCVAYGGGEANAAVSLSNFGVHTEFVTKLPITRWGTPPCNLKIRRGVKHIVREAAEWAYIFGKGASQGRPRSYTTEAIRRWRKRPLKILILTKYLKTPIGFILRA